MISIDQLLICDANIGNNSVEESSSASRKTTTSSLDSNSNIVRDVIDSECNVTNSPDDTNKIITRSDRKTLK